MLEAYPILRRLCAILGLEFQVVDMRWGVRAERRLVVNSLKMKILTYYSDTHGTAELCMSEVEKCLTKSLSIAFVSIKQNTHFITYF